MCRIWPLHLIILYLLVLCPIWVYCKTTKATKTPKTPKSGKASNPDEPNTPILNASFLPAQLELSECKQKLVNVTITYAESGPYSRRDIFFVWSKKNETASAKWTLNRESTVNQTLWQGQFAVRGHCVGLECQWQCMSAEQTVETCHSWILLLDDVVSLMYIFLGCDMNWPTAKKGLMRPIGLVIGMVGRFLFLPLISFWFGPVIFPDLPKMRMILFFTGVSPVCGTASIWTLIIEGNLDLSLLMTCIFMLSSIVLMPFWLFILGPVLFSDEIGMMPYWSTAKYSMLLLALQLVGLMAPFALGICLQRWTPRLARFIVFVLENFFTALFLLFMLLLCSMTCTIFVSWNTFLSAEVYMIGMFIPWLGFLYGYIVMRICKQTHYDSLAISLVTGMLNTSIPLLLLQYSVSQTGCGAETVLPLAMAIIAPIPLVVIFIIVKMISWYECMNSYEESMPAVLFRDNL